MAGRKRSCWRYINVEERDVGLVYSGFDGLYFDVRVRAEGDVDGFEEDGMMDEKPQTTPSSPLAILEDAVVAWE